MPRLTGAEIMAHLLERQGVQRVFGIPGGSNLPFYDALARTDIRHVLARHEQGAGFMAQGAARVSGEPGVFIATSGPGATNTLTALADARLDSVPLVCITGQVPRALIGTDAFQEVDIFGMSIPVTKHNWLVRSAAELLEVIPAAFRIAASGRPGPVLLDVPKDVQTEMLEFEAWPAPGLPEPPPPPGPGALRKAAALITRAERPLIYAGGGVAASGAAGLVRELAERTGAPVAMTLMGLGILPDDHPLSLGMLGMHGAPATNLALEECDLLVALGARFDDRATGLLREFCPRASVVHVDIDAGELGKLRTPQAAVTGDVGEALRRMLPELAPRRREAWRARIAELKAEHPLTLPRTDDPRSPYGVIRAAARHLPADGAVATDVGQHQMRTAQACPGLTPRRWLTSGGLGTMGFGLPAAIGAALTLGRRVVCFSGDGSLMMNIQELATAAEEQADVTVVLVDNRALGLVCQQQDLFCGGRRTASQYRHGVDFVRLAEGFGLRAVDLDAAEDPEDALRRAMTEPGPCLVTVRADAAEHVYPMVPPGAANREMIEGARHAHAIA
ncbi:MAG: acetolactate synthase large subunit [Desulfovibrionaceae bacterium]